MTDQNPWLEFETIINTQLEMQVALSLDRHHQFMFSHGLPGCQCVADLGTGNGSFLAKIARLHPEIRYYGVDNQSNMIDEARSQNVTNVIWTLADAEDEGIVDLLGKVDGILMRYFVLHIPNTHATLERILGKVRKGTCLWVFDIDPDLSACDPQDEAFSAFMDLVRIFCSTHFTEIRTASMLPPILGSIGFDVREVTAEPFNNHALDNGLMAEYLYREALLYHHFLEGTRISATLQKIEHFLFREMHRKTHFVQYGMAMIGAVKN
jgi:SAM-dependent methyltransferase